MNSEELQKIINDLTLVRDKSITVLSDQKLVEQVFRIQINIFVSTYFMTATELLSEVKDLTNAYQAYFRLRTSGVRYLLELYLTFVHIVNIKEEDRFCRVYMMDIKEKIDLHQTDLDIHRLSNTKETTDKLFANNENYAGFIAHFGNFLDKMPETIDDFFENGTSIKKSLKPYGFESDIAYVNEIKTNTKIAEDAKWKLLSIYYLLSLDTHPKLSTLIEFEKFIGSTEEQKKIGIQKRRVELASFLKFIAEQMLLSVKEIVD